MPTVLRTWCGGCAATFVLLLASLARSQALVQLPRPTGPSPVGLTSWLITDDARREQLSADGGARMVRVLAWYPATTARGPLAPYLNAGVFEVRSFAALLGAPLGTFDSLKDVRTHAVMDAPPRGGGQLPALVFSHGFGGSAAAYTTLMEDLASHGYIVLSIVHPYEAGAATLDEGRVVSLVNGDGRLRQSFLDVVNEWKMEDASMAAVTRTADEQEQRRLLRDYLSTLRLTNVALKRWVDDTRLVVDRLGGAPRGSAAARLLARIDRSRIGFFGHSMGGVTTGQFCVEDRRCRAGLNLDGIPQYGAMIDARLSKPFLMVYSERPGRLGASDAIYRAAASPYYRVDVADTRHVDFSDMSMWGDLVRQRGASGSIAPERAVDVTRTIVREYFDQELLGRASPLLARKSSLAGVTVTSSAPAGKPPER